MSEEIVGGPVSRIVYNNIRARLLHESQGHLDATDKGTAYAKSLLIARYELQLYAALISELCQTKLEAEIVSKRCQRMLSNLPIHNPAEQYARSKFQAEISKLCP